MKASRFLGISAVVSAGAGVTAGCNVWGAGGGAIGLSCAGFVLAVDFFLIAAFLARVFFWEAAFFAGAAFFAATAFFVAIYLASAAAVFLATAFAVTVFALTALFAAAFFIDVAAGLPEKECAAPAFLAATFFVTAFFATTFLVAAFFSTAPLAAEDLGLLALLAARASVATASTPAIKNLVRSFAAASHAGAGPRPLPGR